MEGAAPLPQSKRTIKEALDSAIDTDQLEKIVREALSAEKEVAVDVELELQCKKCKHQFRQRPRVKVLVPDWNARKGFLQLAIEHSQGRAPTAATPKPKPVFGGDMEELTDDQLLELMNTDAEAQEVPDGEADSGSAEEAA